MTSLSATLFIKLLNLNTKSSMFVFDAVKCDVVFISVHISVRFLPLFYSTRFPGPHPPNSVILIWF